MELGDGGSFSLSLSLSLCRSGHGHRGRLHGCRRSPPLLTVLNRASEVRGRRAGRTYPRSRGWRGGRVSDEETSDWGLYITVLLCAARPPAGSPSGVRTAASGARREAKKYDRW